MSACRTACLALLAFILAHWHNLAMADWRDQIVYFVLLDRFDDGDPSNNRQGPRHLGIYDPRRSDRYSGGDLKGLERRLDYIAGLGMSAVWISPPVRQQWWEPKTQSSGYHGYWAADFKSVDPHLGTLADYQRLARRLRERGMRLIQDIVLNHTGDYFDINPQNGSYQANRGSIPAAPLQWPFSMNDPRRAKDRRYHIFHWTPAISNYNDPDQEARYQMSGLDDLNTDHPTLRRALRESYGFWIDKVGVDAFRIDTAFYVSPEFLYDFMHSPDPSAPGMHERAARRGINGFFAFGEGFGIDRKGESLQSKRIESYMHDASGRQVLGGMLNFPLYAAFDKVFARGASPAYLLDRLTEMQRLHPRWHWMPSFLDNHDVDRFLSAGDETGLRLAMLAMMTLPGIPVVYYGTEQGFKLQRPAMFAKGWGSGGRSHFDLHAPMATWVRALSELRRSNKLWSRAGFAPIAASRDGPGLLAFARAASQDADRSDDFSHEGLVLMNTASQPRAVPLNLLGLSSIDPRWIRLAWSADGGRDAYQKGDRDAYQDGGRDAHQMWGSNTYHESEGLIVLAPGSALVLEVPAALINRPSASSNTKPAQGMVDLIAQWDPAKRLSFVADEEGRLPSETLAAWIGDGEEALSVIVREEQKAWSQPQSFVLKRARRKLFCMTDPVLDDRGPSGTYRYPTGSHWEAIRAADLRKVEIVSDGEGLEFVVEMAAISQRWAPRYGFDHVMLTLFLELPNRSDGQIAMPLQFGNLPDGMRWHLRARLGGWSQALFSSKDSSNEREGTAVLADLAIEADPAARRITFRLPGHLLRPGESWHGSRIYINTWDYDAGYRPLQPLAGPFQFGGAQPTAAREMDAMGPFRLNTGLSVASCDSKAALSP